MLIEECCMREYTEQELVRRQKARKLIEKNIDPFGHRFDVGYYHDIDSDANFKKLEGAGIGTFRARYMMDGSQSLLNYENKEKFESIEKGKNVIYRWINIENIDD